MNYQDNLPLNSEQEKIALEHQAAKLFMRHYEQLSGTLIRHIWHNQPNKPDVSCRLDGQKLDLEIAHLYGSEQEAMKILGRQLSDLTRQELRELEQQTNADQRLLSALQRILYNKAQKQYQTQRVWLVIRNAHPSWDAAQIKALQHCIQVPQSHPFEQIWMVADWSGASGIVQLYP